MVRAGAPIGVTLSFRIASPLVNEVAIALLLGISEPVQPCYTWARAWRCVAGLDPASRLGSGAHFFVEDSI